MWNKQIRDTKTQAWTLNVFNLSWIKITVYAQDHSIETA